MNEECDDALDLYLESYTSNCMKSSLFLLPADPESDIAIGFASYAIWDTVFSTVAQITSRIIIDERVSRNREWLQTMKEYPANVASVGMTMRRQWPFLRFLVYPFLSFHTAVETKPSICPGLLFTADS